MSDLLWVDCHICDKRIRQKRVNDRQVLPPWLMIRWYEAVIAHVRSQHLGKAR